MITFKDYLVWYNNLDVEPFVEAIEKMFDQPRNLDLLKEFCSRVCTKKLFSDLGQLLNTFFSLFQLKEIRICIINLKKISSGDFQSFSTGITKKTKRISAVGNYVNEFGELMRMHYTFGLYHNQCQPGIMLGEGKKMISKKRNRLFQ
jgi:hypothetical protein